LSHLITLPFSIGEDDPCEGVTEEMGKPATAKEEMGDLAEITMRG
jgi:hypothetical protein